MAVYVRSARGLCGGVGVFMCGVKRCMINGIELLRCDLILLDSSRSVDILIQYINGYFLF